MIKEESVYLFFWLVGKEFWRWKLYVNADGLTCALFSFIPVGKGVAAENCSRTTLYSS